MNIITDVMPTQIEVNNRIFEPVTDYRAGVEFELLIENGETDIEKQLKPFFPQGLPADLVGAVQAVLWFYTCGAERKKEDEKEVRGNTEPVYSFRVDSEAIYADFLQFYGLDLSIVNMHWWKFRALLMGLPEDSSFKKRIYYRTCNLKEFPKSEKKRIAKIRKEIKIETALTEHKTLNERNQNMLDYVKKRGEEIWQTTEV